MVFHSCRSLSHQCKVLENFQQSLGRRRCTTFHVSIRPILVVDETYQLKHYAAFVFCANFDVEEHSGSFAISHVEQLPIVHDQLHRNSSKHSKRLCKHVNALGVLFNCLLLHFLLTSLFRLEYSKAHLPCGTSSSSLRRSETPQAQLP